VDLARYIIPMALYFGPAGIGVVLGAMAAGVLGAIIGGVLGFGVGLLIDQQRSST
jgi:outer membrane lipoprotein SlyB